MHAFKVGDKGLVRSGNYTYEVVAILSPGEVPRKKNVIVVSRRLQYPNLDHVFLVNDKGRLSAGEDHAMDLMPPVVSMYTVLLKGYHRSVVPVYGSEIAAKREAKFVFTSEKEANEYASYWKDIYKDITVTPTEEEL